MLIYLGVFFILPDKVRKKILTNGLLCTTMIAAFLAGLYSISIYSISEGFYQSDGSGAAFASESDGCPTDGRSCYSLNNSTPYCLMNEKRLPTSDVDQTVIFNIYGRYVRVYPPETGGDGHSLLSQVVVNNAAGTNIALNQAATATGTHSESTRNPASVVDGTLTPRTWPNIWHSASNNRATDYWQVDLGSRQMITTVRIMVESNVSAGRTTGLRVVVLENTADEREHTSEQPLLTADIDQTVNFNSPGRYVRIYAPETAGDAYINISQVIVNNAEGTNIALNKTVTATSTLPGGKPPSGVVDGTTTSLPWPQLWHNNSNNANRATDHLQIDLGSTQMISTIRIIGRKDPSPNRMTGLRIRVVRMIPNVGYFKGICAADPTPIYPTGTTDDEKKVIGPMILDGMNGQTALNIYRGISSLPSTFTNYGLTDSQSAAAAVMIKSENLSAQRRAGALNDSSYYSSMNPLKSMTTMAKITFSVSTELSIYMTANQEVKKTVESSARQGLTIAPTITSNSDGGKGSATKLIMSVLNSSRVDPSAGNSKATVPEANVALDAAPNTEDWAQSVMQHMPQETRDITVRPTSGPTTVTATMTPQEKENAVRANNPKMVVITPFMSRADKEAAIRAANAAQNVPIDGTSPPSESVRNAAAQAVSSGKGFSSPNTSYAGGGQGQWYMRKVSVPSSQAAAKCTEYGGRLATLKQIQYAQEKGASYTVAGWYSGTVNAVAYPNDSGVQSSTAGTGNYEVNCYGPKPPPGTADVAPWRNTAKTISGGPTYVANDWSERRGGDGGVAKNEDNSIKNPGTPLITQEVYYVGGTQSLTKEQSTRLCEKLGGQLATSTQLQAAVTAGAKWCGAGWLSDTNVTSQAGSGCASETTSGATCFGIKPSMNSTNDNRANISASNAGVSFPVYAEPFNKTMTGSIVTSVSWTQVTRDNGLSCRQGTRSEYCLINGVITPTCLENGKTCDNSCDVPTAGNVGRETSERINGQTICSGTSKLSGNCPAGSRQQLCSGTQSCTQESNICKKVCVPTNGDCTGAFSHMSFEIVEKPADISREDYRNKCNLVMTTMDYWARTRSTFISRNPGMIDVNRGIPYPSVAMAIPAIEYTASGQNKQACCWGGTPVQKPIYLVNEDPKDNINPRSMAPALYREEKWRIQSGYLKFQVGAGTYKKFLETDGTKDPITTITTGKAAPTDWGVNMQYAVRDTFTALIVDTIWVCPGPTEHQCTENSHCLSGRCNIPPYKCA